MPSVSTTSTAHPFQTDDARLRAIHEKVVAKHRLDGADIAALYASKDILAIGWLANFVRERMHAHATRFCVASVAVSDAARVAACALCGKSPLAADVSQQLDQVDGNPEEIVLLNGDPRKLERLLRAIGAVRRRHPNVRVLAGTAGEIAEVTKGDAAQIGEICRSLRAAGADGLAGEGAEVFIAPLRHRMWQHAGIPAAQAVIYRGAQAAGLAVPIQVVQRAATTAEEQAAQMVAIRELAPTLTSFAVLSFDPDVSTSLDQPVTTGMQEMKQIAIARLALDNVAHIRAYWQMLGGKLIQISLRFGASELDGTPLDPGINREIRRRELAREIEVAGREAQEIKAPRKAVLLA
jgi:aminodeoxyfutalosine synthase